jgi:6-pyruvoyl-tetrahydropterin synthase
MVKLAPYLSSRFIYFTGNPTAENMAQYFFNYIASVLTEGVIVNNLTVWETVTGKATCTFGSATVPTLVVSAAIVEKWSETELNTFHANNGVELTPYRLISDIEIKMVEFGDRDTLTIKAVLKNCK